MNARLRCSLAAALFGALAALAPAQAAPREALRVLAQRGHAQCPLPGQGAQALVLDDAAQWAGWLAQDEASALGRAVDWRRERVLVVALAQQPTLGVRAALDDALPYAGRREVLVTLRVERPAPGTMAAMALSRPCVVAALPRGPWHTVVLRGDARAEGVAVHSVRAARGRGRAGAAQPAAAASSPADVMPLPGR